MDTLASRARLTRASDVGGRANRSLQQLGPSLNHRGATGAPIYDGAREIQKVVIARHVLAEGEQAS
jgi:alkylation response protein AidB-like acyl-CoA dehydrogenase